MKEIIAALPLLASGLATTLELMVASLMLGLVLALLMTIGSRSRLTILRKLINIIVFFVRGTPLLVQIFLVYYGAGQFASVRESILWPLLREPMWCAIIALAINSACYTTVLLQGALQSVPRNEYAACEALGMSRWLAFRRILLPRACRIALPAYSNEVVMILKGTSLASTITLLDIMGVTQQLIAQTYQTLDFYLVAAVLYLIVTAVISNGFKRLNKFLHIYN